MDVRAPYTASLDDTRLPSDPCGFSCCRKICYTLRSAKYSGGQDRTCNDGEDYHDLFVNGEHVRSGRWSAEEAWR